LLQFSYKGRVLCSHLAASDVITGRKKKITTTARIAAGRKVSH
jgi:hypothetical protein